MEARNRKLADWFTRIESGQVRLPRFQRLGEAWSHTEVSALINAVLRELPAGAALVLEVGDQEKFKSRPVEGAPAPTSKATEHLLDGQQRLTALWRSLHDLYEDRTYFALLQDPEEDDNPVLVQSVGRWRRAAQSERYPLWTDRPIEQYRRGLLPLGLLRPGDMSAAILGWCMDATQNDLGVVAALQQRIFGLRERVAGFNLPFLELPSSTPPHVAIDVFVKLNTTSVQLTPFDIIVAQVEASTGQPLRELAANLHSSVPSLRHYAEPGDIELSVAALREDRAPTEASYFLMDHANMVAQWDNLSNGVKRAIEFLTDERVFDRQRLPTGAVLPVLSALWSAAPQALDGLGFARTLLRKYIWRAFLTRRYESAAATRAFQDYRAVLGVLRGESTEAEIPIFNEEQYPLPTAAELIRVPWPKSRDIIARGVLAVSLRGGGLDLADGSPATRESIANREYHHLFPVHLLTEDGKMDEGDCFRAANCALITWQTNRAIAAKEPLRYLRERVDRSVLGVDEIRHRLASHAVPFEELNVGGYDAIADVDARTERVKEDYSHFLDSRGMALERAVRDLCNGRDWSGLVQGLQ